MSVTARTQAGGSVVPSGSDGSMRQALTQFSVDAAFALAARLGMNVARRDQLKMCWRTTIVPPGPVLHAGYTLHRWTGAEPPDGWADVLCAAGLRADERTWTCEFVGHAPFAVHLVSHEGTVVGTAGLRALACEGQRAGVMTFLAVQPDHHGRGLGRALTIAVMREAYDTGVDTVFLATDDQRLAAIGLYLAVGFQPCVNSWDRSHHWRWRRVGRALSSPVAWCRNASHALPLGRLTD